MTRSKQPDSTRAWSDLRAQILTAVRNGDEEVLCRFHQAHVDAIYRFVLCRLDQDHEQAEEVASEVLYQAFRDIEGYDASHAPGAWLLGIALHRVQDTLRRRGRRPQALATGDLSRQAAATGSAVLDLAASELPESWVERDETRASIECVLSGLPPEYEAVLRQHYQEERPLGEIARLLGLSVKAVESRLVRAREAFRGAFRSLHPDWAAVQGWRHGPSSQLKAPDTQRDPAGAAPAP